MNISVFLGLTFLAAYLLGSVPVGWLIARWRGVDILKVGSGNIGATNVGRVIGWKWGLLVFVADFAKGALPVLAALKATGMVAPDVPPEISAVAAAVATFLGHLFPVFLKLRGGKGVATGAGAMVVLVPGPMLIALAFWALVVVSSRTVSLGSLTAAALFCGLRLSRGAEVWDWPGQVVTYFCLTVVGLVFLRHRANISRLFRGKENQIRDSSGLFLFSKVLHILSLGLWFGMAVFFSFVVGVQLFRTFERLSVEPRPFWFPLPAEFAAEPPNPRFPDPLAKEQGSRIAGAAVGPLFDWYYPLQMGCAIVATITALGWSMGRWNETTARVRSRLLLLAVTTVGVGWWLGWEVSALRGTRNETTDAVLKAKRPGPIPLAEATEARDKFARWHLASLLVNFVTVLLVTTAMGLAAALPTWRPNADDAHAAGDETERHEIH